MKYISVHNRSTGAPVAEHIGCADTSLTRLVGLLGHGQLHAGGGIWITPSSGVHTFGMRFCIDVVGVDRSGRVVRLWPNLKPWRLTRICTNIHSVIELAAGEIAARDIQPGHTLEAQSNLQVSLAVSSGLEPLMVA